MRSARTSPITKPMKLPLMIVINEIWNVIQRPWMRKGRVDMKTSTIVPPSGVDSAQPALRVAGQHGHPEIDQQITDGDRHEGLIGHQPFVE